MMTSQSETATTTTTIARKPPTISSDTLKKIMWLYRTRTCPLNKRGQCNYGNRCFDSHQSQPERRAPKQNEYNDWHPSTMKCTSNVPNENCKYGRACYFAHNDFEVDYHPTLYKTKICNQFEKDKTCFLGMICPNYHYIDEQRKIEKGTLSTDCKSDGLSRKAPPPQEFRRWLDEQLRINNHITNINNNNNNDNKQGNNIVVVDKIIDDNNNNNNNNKQLIENEVEIELPSSQPCQPSQSLSNPNLMLRNISDSSSIQLNGSDDNHHQQV